VADKSRVDYDRLDYEAFRHLATSDSLSSHEKVGFPDNYRAGREHDILADICSKVTSLRQSERLILDIGPGCGELAKLLCRYTEQHKHQLLLVDSTEMLSLLPEATHIEKYPGKYPSVEGLFEPYQSKLDGIIVYSVIQYVFKDGNLWDFMDKTLSLLKEGGELLIGDIPNLTMRKRFFSSSEGIESHKAYTGGGEKPQVTFNQLEPGTIDDSVVMALVARARAQGFHAWVVPQAAPLPMANRREDILIRRP
jgi:hypothetical protein